MDHLQQSVQRCCHCDSDEQLFVSLNCQHSFCIVCMCYVVIKSKTKKSDDNLVACPVCDQTTNLDSQSIEAIQHTIENIILPKLSNFSIEELSTEHIQQIEELEKIHGRSIKKTSGETNAPSVKFSADKPLIKISKRFSEDPSYDHLSPTANKYFFSKCMTPVNNSRDSFSGRECCSVHPMQDITSVCLTCDNELVCTKCLLTAKHKGHNVKVLSKGVEFLTEQMNFKKLDVNHRIQNLQLNERRIKGKLDILKQRLLKSQQNIAESFDQIIHQVKRRENELQNECLDIYQSLEEGLLQELQVLNTRVSVLSFARENIDLLLASSNKQYEFLKSYPEVSNLLNNEVEQFVSKPYIEFQSNNYLQVSQEDIAHIFQEINDVYFEGKNSQRNKLMSTKRLNGFVSCHTSKDKDKKKGLKTEDSVKNLMHKKSMQIPKIQTNNAFQQHMSVFQKQTASKSLFYTDRSVDNSKNTTFSKNSISKMLSNRNLLEVEKKIRPFEKEKTEKKCESKEVGKGQKMVDVKRKKRV